jgi:phage gp36-like protein
MTLAALSPVYTDRAQIQGRVSTVGTALRLDDNAGAITQVIEEATTEVNGYCLLLYSAAQLAASYWVRQRATDIAVWFLCARRNNPPPKVVQQRYEKALEDLERVRLGVLVIPDAAQSKAAAPVLSNQRVRLWPFPHVVTEPSQSTGTPTGYTGNEDPVDIDPIN